MPGQFAGVVYHLNDSYTYPWGTDRGTFYGVSTTPVMWLDGTEGFAGTYAGMSYIPKVYEHLDLTTDVVLDLGAEPSGSSSTFAIDLNVLVEPSGEPRNLRIYIVHALDWYPADPTYSRQCFRQALEPLDVVVNPGDSVRLTQEMTFDPTSWSNPENIRIVAWAQDIDSSGPAQVYQAATLAWPLQPLYPLKITLDSLVPEFIAPGVDLPLAVYIHDGRESYLDGSALIHYRFDGGAFLAAPLAHVGGHQYLATLPDPPCGGVPEFYFSAQSAVGDLVTYPSNAPVELLTATIATVTPVLMDDFEIDHGWTVESADLDDGAWQRGMPADSGADGDPLEDWDASGQCFLTANRAGNSDVDGGPTHLISPALDLGGMGDPVLRYARWMSCDDAGTAAEDFLDVAVSTDDGATWLLLEHVPGYEGWQRHEVHLIDHIVPTATVRVRFTTSDNPNNSKTEAAIDAVHIFNLSCETALPGDVNCDGVVNALDIDPFVLVLTDPGGYAEQYPQCDPASADINGDGALDAFDVDPFIELLTP